MRKDSSVVRNHVAANHSEKVKKIISLVPDGGNYRDLPENIEIVEISMLHGQDLQVINLHLLLIQGIDIIFIINIIEYQRLGSVQDYNRFQMILFF